jgi:hypothetical protein
MILGCYNLMNTPFKKFHELSRNFNQRPRLNDGSLI